MKTAIFVTIIALTIALARSIAISNPIASTTWKFGSSQTVEWTTEPSDSGSKTLYLYYTKGQDPKVFQGTEAVAKVEVPDVTAKKATIDLTSVDTSKYPPTSGFYFLRMGDVAGSYSSKFTITGGTCTSCKETSSPAPSVSSAPTVPKSPISSASLSAKSLPTGTLNNTMKATSDAVTVSYSIFAIFAAAVLALL